LGGYHRMNRLQPHPSTLPPCRADLSPNWHGARGTVLRGGVVLQSVGHIHATFNSAYGQLLGVGVGVTRRPLSRWEGEVRKWRGLWGAIGDDVVG
jgi:hypothetical protein